MQSLPIVTHRIHQAPSPSPGSVAALRGRSLAASCDPIQDGNAVAASDLRRAAGGGPGGIYRPKAELAKASIRLAFCGPASASKIIKKTAFRVTARAVNGQFNVSVADTGPGIPEHERTRIFEQFHQIDSSLTKAAGGTGLGLAIAKQIVEMHGGRIWVESTLGKGSTFQMEIPTRPRPGDR